MSRRALAILLALVGGLALLSVLLSLGDRAGPARSDSLVPGLRARLNDVARIVVRSGGDNVIATLVRADEGWLVEERGGYPADVARIRKNLIALADAVILEEKTSNPELYGRLGVADLEDPSARGIGLRLKAGDEAMEIIVGDRGPDDESSYVRRAGERTSWLVSGRFDLGRETHEWLDRAVLDLPAERVTGVVIAHPDGERLRIGRAADGDGYAVADVPAGRELLGPWVAGNIAGALADLRLEDVHSRDALGEDPGKPVVATFSTDDGLRVESSAWRTGDGTRFTFIASTAPDAADTATAGAEALNARVAGHVYTLASFKAEQLTRRMRDLLAPAE